MFSNRLKINMDNTQFIWLGLHQQAKLNVRTITLADVDIEVSDEVTCLGVVLDSTLTFVANVKKRARSCLHQLRQLRAVRRTLSIDAAKILVYAVLTTRVDYCNSVLYGITTTNLRRLQSVINAAARLITGKCKFDHITDTLRDDLHWLATSPPTHPTEVVLVSQQVTAPYGVDIVPVHPSVGDMWPHSSTFCCLLWPRRFMDSLGPLWTSRFHRLGSSDLEQSATSSPRYASVCC